MSARTIIPGVDDLDKFNEKYIPEPMSGCWLWLGAPTKKGYGSMQINRRTEPAHRVSYRLHIGEIPDALCVLHKCDVRPCVNPDHLFLGTIADNNADMIAKGRDSFAQHGEDNHKAKLTEGQVLEIRSSAETTRRLGAKYGVTSMQISRIKRRQLWKRI